MRQVIGVLGTPIDKLNLNNVIERLDQFIQEGRFHQVATANTDFLINAITDPELRHILREADLVVPDGMPVVWGSQLMGCPLPERVAGADIVPRLAKLSAQKGYRIYMLGARPEVAARAKARMEADYPGVQIVGCESPPCSSIVEMDSTSILDDITRARPDILLVAFGNPKQEKWIHMHREWLQDVPVCMGVGGTFDFMAGEVPRAPSVLQRSGLEWTHRLLHNPRRLWRRYARDLFQGGKYLLRQWRSLRRQRESGQFDLHVAHTGECAILSPVGDLTRIHLPRFRAAADEALNSGARLILDLQGVTSFDAHALGALLNLPKRAAYCLQEVRMLAVPRDMERLLRDCHLDDELYPFAETVAHAVTEWEHDGLYWRVQSGKEAAVVTVNGSANSATTDQLEQTCRVLINICKRIDLDARGVTYVDAYFLSALFRLNSMMTCRDGYRDSAPSQLRIACGSTLREALTRENVLGSFIIMDAPEVPKDASDVASFALEMHSIHRSGRVTQAAHAERTPMLSVITTS
jgi:N-acetylglucosaminyldiphosphoundecaprenol N-acetyl-beta-D-mannosaminyltransferase